MTIAPGETVTFNYPSGLGPHNVGFVTRRPAADVVRADLGHDPDPAVFPVPPLPQFTHRRRRGAATARSTPPARTLLCAAHGDMTGDITVAAPANAPPTVTAGRTPTGDATTGTSIAFTATGTDADGDTLTYAWDFGDGGDVDAAEPDAHLRHAGHQDRDGHGVRRQGRHGVGDADDRRHPGQPQPDGDRRRARPRASLAVGQSAAFTATGTDADGDTLTYSWDFGDSTPASTQQNPSHAYAAAGDYTAKVTVSDGKGGTGTANVAVTVTLTGNANPTVTSNRTPTGATRVGIPISFTAVGTDADGDTLTYSWNFGDGTPVSTEQNPVHTFLTVNTFNVVVTVNDGRGGTASATPLSVQVQANRAPTITTATATPAEGMAPLNVTFAATARGCRRARADLRVGPRRQRLVRDDRARTRRRSYTALHDGDAARSATASAAR